MNRDLGDDGRSPRSGAVAAGRGSGRAGGGASPGDGRGNPELGADRRPGASAP